MCLIDRKTVSIDEIDAWKVFAEKEGQLISPFKSAHYYPAEPNVPLNLESYIVNSRIQVKPVKNVFFAFKNFRDAYMMANYAMQWSVISADLIILPVTIYNVITEGRIVDITQEGKESFEAKEIKVHDSPEIRLDISRKCLNYKLFRHKKGLSSLHEPIEKLITKLIENQEVSEAEFDKVFYLTCDNRYSYLIQSSIKCLYLANRKAQHECLGN